MGFKDVRIGERTVQAPVVDEAATRSTLTLPARKAAVLRWSLPEGKERLLIVRARPLE